MGSGAAVPSTSIGTNTIQKMRLRILPFVFLLYVIAQLDRNNIGIAALTMNQDLAVTSQQYGFDPKPKN
jgi:MFS transporter, ACS family, tartrate transporter